MVHARTHTPVREHEDVRVLWYQGVHTDRELTANWPDIIIKNKKEKTCILTGVAIPADRNVTQKAAENKLQYNISCTEIQQMYDQTGNDWGHRNSNKMFTETFVSRNGKLLNRFSTKYSCSRNITKNTESTAV
jgi:hypothetical protein